MPIYEYRCTSCGHHFENLQKISEPLLVDCPSCGKSALEKCVSAPSFQLKGSGWYATDYKAPKKDEQEKPSAETKVSKKEETS